MSENTPFFSVIVPCYNRLEEVKDLVASLAAQDFPPDRFEVLIVDDGSTDGTRSWCLEAARSSPFAIRCPFQDHQGPGPARNIGAAQARGRYLLFIDSDCLAPPDWLSTLYRRLQADPEIGGFGGRDDAHPDFPPLLKAINYAMTSFLTTGGLRGGKKRRLATYYPRSFNMGIRRDLFAHTGGFGTLRHGQDIAFSHRMRQAGIKIVYLPDSVVYHKRRGTLWGFFKQVFNWGVARINLYQIDRRLLEPLHAVPAMAFWSLVCSLLVAAFWPPSRAIVQGVLGIGLVLLLGSGIHAGFRWKNAKTALLTPVVMILQVFGYALGFTVGWLVRVLFRHGPWRGFA